MKCLYKIQESGKNETFVNDDNGFDLVLYSVDICIITIETILIIEMTLTGYTYSPYVIVE